MSIVSLETFAKRYVKNNPDAKFSEIESAYRYAVNQHKWCADIIMSEIIENLRFEFNKDDVTMRVLFKDKLIQEVDFKL